MTLLQQKLRRDKIHYVCAPLFIGVWLLLYYLITIMHFFPQVVQIDEYGSYGKFQGARAFKDQNQLKQIGPRPVGSIENERDTIKFLIKTVDAIRDTMKHDLWQIETDIQVASGAYERGSRLNMYQGIKNYVVKFSYKESNSTSSLLINSHFDTVPQSPGVGDDGNMVVVMLEILRVLSKSFKILTHSIIFLFNGAEETHLQGSHAFITQHKWASTVKAYINLDSAGNRGRELLFQSTSEYGLWLLKYYKDNAPHPAANTLFEELFRHGLIPSDTDFRIFRDFGHLPGLDFAPTENGYVYHTKFDETDYLYPEYLQNTGNNILAIAKALINGPELEHPMAQEAGDGIFFDFINVFLILYPAYVGFILNVLILALTSVLIYISLRWMSKNPKVTLKHVFGRFGITLIVQFSSIVLAIALSIAIAFFIDLSNLSLSWFYHPWLIFGLYFCPLYFVLSVIPAVYLHVSRNDFLPFNHKIQLFLHAHGSLLVLILLGFTIVQIRSGYLFMVALIFYDLSLVINLITTMQKKPLIWVIPLLICQIIPVIFFSSLARILFVSIIPMQGRVGPFMNPEFIICAISIVFGLLIGGFLVPLLNIFRKSVLVSCLFLVITIIFIIVASSSVGFPYKKERAPQRIGVSHMKRILHNVDQSVNTSDSGYFLMPSDRNVWTIPKFILKGVELPKKEDYCKDYFNCGLLPINPSSDIIYWLPSGKPNLGEGLKLELISKQSKGNNLIRYTFKLTGPDRIVISIAPMRKTKLVDWSFLPISFEKRRRIYEIDITSAADNKPITFFLDFQIPPDWNESVFNFVVTSHLIHHTNLYTAEYKEFLETIPTWIYADNKITLLEQWIF